MPRRRHSSNRTVDLHVVGLDGRRTAKTSVGQAVRPPAQRVDEVTALAGEAGSFELFVPVPAVGLKLPGVDQVAHDRAGAWLAEP